MTLGMKTYVEYIRPDRNIPAGVSAVAEVKDRDIQKLDIPRNCDIFYFYDSPADTGDIRDTQNAQYNVSRFHIVAERLLTREEAKKMIAPHLSKDAMAQIVWDARLEQHEVFALTRNRNIEPVRKDTIVIDAQKNRLYPKPAPDVTPKEDFDMALKRPVPAAHPATFKKRPPPSLKP